MSTRGAIVTGMATRIYKNRQPRLFLKEHREQRLPPLTAKQLGERLSMHEKSVYRTEAEPGRLNNDEKRQQWAEALGLEHWHELTRPPGLPKRKSLDEIVRDEPDEVVDLAAEYVARLVASRRR